MNKTIELIEEKLEDFGLLNINENTVVFVNKEDANDVEVADSEFNTFTKAHSTCARYLVNFDEDCPAIDSAAVADFVNNEC